MREWNCPQSFKDTFMIENFINGLFWGLGFMTAVLLTTPVYFLITRFFAKRTSEIIADYSGVLNGLGGSQKKLSKSSGVRIEDCDFRVRDEVIEIVGSISNNGKDCWLDTQIEVQLLDEAGKLIDVETEELDGLLEPGQTRRFLISSYGDDLPAAVKASAVSAEHYTENESETESV